ncbi:zinc finger protein 106 isoform X2 [Narcine bancroftii]
MDEHMRSMLHHRELENLKGRDCKHECRVCKVTVVGLSAYAKHISSQHHKEKVKSQEGEENHKDNGKEEEYFDKELIQLIGQRKEQRRKNDTPKPGNRTTDGDDWRYRRKREDHQTCEPVDQRNQSMRYHDNAGEWEWDWGSRDYPSCRSSTSQWKSNSEGSSNRHSKGTRGFHNWHPDDKGGASNWYLKDSWHPSGSGGAVSCHYKNQGGLSKSGEDSRSHYKRLQLGNNGNSMEEQEWKRGKVKVQTLNKMGNRSVRDRRGWEKAQNWRWPGRNRSGRWNPNDYAMQQCYVDFTSDDVSSEGMLRFNTSKTFLNKGTQSGGKSLSPPRDKRHRWTPYWSQKSKGLFTGNKSKKGNNCGKNFKLATVRNVKSQHKDGALFPGKITEELSNDVSNLTQHARDENKALDKGWNQLSAVRHTKLIPSPPSSSASESNPNKDDPSFNEASQMSLKSPNLEAHSCSLLDEGTQQLPSASEAYLSTDTGTDPTAQPLFVIPSCGDKPQLDNSLNEMLRLAREALRQSLSECDQDGHLESGGDSVEGNKENWKISNNNYQAPVDARKTSEELIEIAEELDPNAVVNSGHLQPCAQTIKEQTTMLAVKYDDMFKVCITKGDSKATLASSTFFGESETKNANEVQSSVPTETFDGCSSDTEQQNGGTLGSNQILSELNKLGLPTSVQRDLTRHINSKSRPGTHIPEPNLNIARRIRSIGSQRKSESEKESGLKPTVRQLLNVSRHHVNWDQLIQQVAKKKQELGKGLPRFGIEMVPSVQTSLEAPELDEDEKQSSLEGFQWEVISSSPAGTIRKRSLSESSVVTDKQSIYNLFGNDLKHLEGATGKEQDLRVPSSKLPPPPPGPKTSTCQMKQDVEDNSGFPETRQVANDGDKSSFSTQALPSVKNEENSDRLVGFDSISVKNSEAEKESSLSATYGSCQLGAEGNDTVQAQQSSSGAVQAPIAADGATDSSDTSGGELNDNQMLGKKRRATADGLSPEVTGLERKNKRRKIKNKRDRGQLDQLLSISLQEDELNKTCQEVEGNLLRARAALQAAYLEVQKLLLLRQQVTMEMGTLRTKRIEILQGLQEFSVPPGERIMQSPGTETSSLHRGTSQLNFHIPFSPLLHPTSFPGSSTDLQPQLDAVPCFGAGAQGPLPAVLNASIKQEPASPKRPEEIVKNSAPLHLAGQMMRDCRGSSLSPVLLPAVYAKDEVTSTGFPMVTLPSPLLTRLGHGGKGVEVGHTCHRTSKTSTNIPPASAQKSGPNTGTPQQSESFIVPEKCSSLTADKRQKCPRLQGREGKGRGSELQQVVESSITPVENIRSKKKKFRKKKSLRVAQSGENSDTEQDTELVRPQRKAKSKKVSKAKVTTSTPRGTDGTSRADSHQKGEGELHSASSDSDSSIELVEMSNPNSEVVDIESVESASEQHNSPAKSEDAALVQGEADPLKAAYGEVTSTSEIGSSCAEAVVRGVTETQTPVSSQRESRNTSEMSSDDGEEENPTEGAFEGHQAAVNAMQIYGGQLYTCSADKTVHIYNLTNRQRVGTFEAHSTKVNCLLIVQLQRKQAHLYTGSSDHTIRCYDVKTKVCLDQFTLSDRVLSLHSRWRILYVGLANGSVFTFGVKNNKQLDVFDCHGPRAVSCLATAQEGARRLLLVGSYDCTISVRDAGNGLLLRTLEGHTKTVLCMKVINDLVFSGSSDQSVHAHNIHTGELVQIYKGHSHAVTVVNILGKVMVTACLDKMVRVYELQSHDRLQVYGGHKDMVMCMVIHKSMIYTGCYDGSIQAVRLNLMQNYRCWWAGCTLIFGVLAHLKHHLVTNHNSNSSQIQKCRWRHCAFFTVRNGSKQDFPKHLCQHAEENSQQDP